MAEALDRLLQELEDLSAKALQEALASDLTAAAQSIAVRGLAVQRWQDQLATAGTVTYEEWNRLAVIHFQGNRILEAIGEARRRLAADATDHQRARALLNCVTAVVGRTPRVNSTLNETA